MAGNFARLQDKIKHEQNKPPNKRIARYSRPQ